MYVEPAFVFHVIYARATVVTWHGVLLRIGSCIRGRWNAGVAIKFAVPRQGIGVLDYCVKFIPVWEGFTPSLPSPAPPALHRPLSVGSKVIEFFSIWPSKTPFLASRSVLGASKSVLGGSFSPV